MHIITRKRLLEFAEKHPDWNTAFESWYTIVRQKFDFFAKLKKTFPSVDQVAKLKFFNIGGNKARLIAAIHYHRSRVSI